MRTRTTKTIIKTLLELSKVTVELYLVIKEKLCICRAEPNQTGAAPDN